MLAKLKILEKWLFSIFSKSAPEQIKKIIEEEILDYFKSNKTISEYRSKNNIDQKSLIDLSAYVIHVHSNKPWIKQSEIMKNYNINKDLLIEINTILKKSNLLQKAIVNHGRGKKYWETIIPFSNKIQNVLNYKYNYPLRLAFYPGVSCMFFCGFCGRNQLAKYPLNAVESGFKMYKNILKNFPKTSAVSISGGLEPLTNPKLGNIISYAKSINIRVPLITNGYSLTKNYLLKNPGI